MAGRERLFTKNTPPDARSHPMSAQVLSSCPKGFDTAGAAEATSDGARPPPLANTNIAPRAIYEPLRGSYAWPEPDQIDRDDMPVARKTGPRGHICVTVRHMCDGPYSAHPSGHMSHPLIGCDRCDGGAGQRLLLVDFNVRRRFDRIFVSTRRSLEPSMLLDRQCSMENIAFNDSAAI